MNGLEIKNISSGTSKVTIGYMCGGCHNYGSITIVPPTLCQECSKQDLNPEKQRSTWQKIVDYFNLNK